jgi:hypothetical protein
MLVNFYHFLYTSHRENMLTFQILNQAHPPYFPENILWTGRRNPRRCTRCCINSVYHVGLLVDNKSGEEAASNIGITRIFQIR